MSHEHEPPQSPPTVNDAITLEEAAELLFVSRVFMQKLIASGEIRATPNGMDRADVVAYKLKMSAAQNQAMNDLVRESEKLGLYDPVNPKSPLK